MADDDGKRIPRFTLYWSSLELYEKCPQRFLWTRGWGNLDVGGGPGNKKPVPKRESEHHAIMGKAIQGVIEDFYNEEWWRPPVCKGCEKPLTLQTGTTWICTDLECERVNVPVEVPGLAERMERATIDKFDYYADKPGTYCPFGGFSVFGKVPKRGEMLNTCVEGVWGYLRTLKHNKLIGPFAKAEVNLVGYINEYHPVGGRADVIIRRDDTGVTILDGKNSMAKDKHTDPDQLRWYALCFYLCYQRLPDRLAFVYYRYPYDEETGEEGVDWVDFTPEDVKGLARRAVDARNAMNRHEFSPTPTPQNCKYCMYESICQARQDQKASRRRKKKTPTELDKDIGDRLGLVELDFGQ